MDPEEVRPTRQGRDLGAPTKSPVAALEDSTETFVLPVGDVACHVVPGAFVGRSVL
ncbi:hypothetical protein AB0O58_15555 [Rhodococcus sp. NPDC080181]|uniref:hypothetical protein n=1 Tax=Rhodococcus sp. NPDC080181 TaxID=3155292 RepID=UPI00344EEF69